MSKNQSTNNIHQLPTEKSLSFDNKKKFNVSDIKVKARPVTKNHAAIINAIESGKKTINYGTAGTGKTFITLNLALQQLADKQYDQIIIFRSAVGVRDDGFLPGTDKEKMAPYEEPYQEIVKETLGTNNPNCYNWIRDTLKLLDFRSTRFNQGVTFHRTFMIVDEAQNMTYSELFNLATRLGENSTIHFCGDYQKQNFLKKGESGFEKFINVINSDEATRKHFCITKMTSGDNMRNDFVRDFIIVDEKYHLKKS